MASDTENEMKCVNDNSGNIDVYRKLVQTYLKMNLYSTALFWADKVLALSSGAPEDVYWLAQCMYMLKQYHRAAQLIKNRELEKSYVLCNYLVVRCLLEANELAEAMRVLNSLTVDIFQQSLCSSGTNTNELFDNAPKNIQSAMLVIKGKLLEAMDNRGLAADCFRQALQYDVYCYEAYEALIQHQMLSASEEKELLESIPIAKQCSETEAAVLQMLYESKLKKYHSPSELPEKEFTANVNAVEEMICVPTTAGLTSTPHMEHASAEPPGAERSETPPPSAHTLFTKLLDSLDLMVTQAETFYYNCEYRKCKRLTELVLKRDPYHCECLPVHIACLVELKEANCLFSLAHKLVDLYPDLAISWFAVGCYYYVIGKSDPARRYLSKATTIDRLFGPAWLAYGHSFAVENEHDQAMAVYFKASQLMKGCHLPLLYIGLECGLTNNVRLAEKFFQQAQAVAPRDPFVMHEMGVIAFQTLDYKAAEKYFKQALDRIRSCQDTIMVEKWEPLLNNLGHTCRKLKKYEEALEYHHQALLVSPQNPGTYSAIGYTKALMGHTQEAVDWFHKTLGLRRDDTFSTTMLNYVIEQLVEESSPFPGAPDHIPDFSICSSKASAQDEGSKFDFEDALAVVAAAAAKEGEQTSTVPQESSTNDMSMSFEVEMPDASETS